jgi:hypothetical protein
MLILKHVNNRIELILSLVDAFHRHASPPLAAVRTFPRSSVFLLTSSGMIFVCSKLANTSSIQPIAFTVYSFPNSERMHQLQLNYSEEGVNVVQHDA